MKYSIITISREHGSGGRLIAEKLSKKLGIPYYDKELIELTANGAGVSAEYVKHAEYKRNSSFLYNLYVSTNNLPVDDQVYITQSEAIKKLAEKGSCIIVGRCADYVLRERVDCLRTFVYAPIEHRIERMKNVYGEADVAVETILKKRDKYRAEYYNYYTNSHFRWGEQQNYHLLINSELGIEKACSLIITAFGQEEIR